jgi:hypothetical protein
MGMGRNLWISIFWGINIPLVPAILGYCLGTRLLTHSRFFRQTYTRWVSLMN